MNMSINMIVFALVIVAGAGCLGWFQPQVVMGRLSKRFRNVWATIYYIVALGIYVTLYILTDTDDILKSVFGAVMTLIPLAGVSMLVQDICYKLSCYQLQEGAELRASIERTKGIAFTGRTYAELPASEAEEAEEFAGLGLAILSQTDQLFLREALEQEVAHKKRLGKAAQLPQPPVFAKKPGDCPENYADLLPQLKQPLTGRHQFQPRIAELKPCLPWQR